MIVRDRVEVVHQISDLLDNTCADCPKRKELNKTYGSIFSRIDGYCNKECAIGQQLQGLGAKLNIGLNSRMKIKEER